VRTALKALVAVAVFALIIAPPFLLGTKVYPVAVVQGNSMFPVLQNGELVIFRGVNTENIQNGTIVVAVEGGAPANFLNYFTRPVIIHEVYARIVNQYGRVYYQTKGVNNPYPDPFLVPQENILGTPVFSIPYVGFFILFVSSPEGLVFLIGVLTVYYIESYERAKNKEKAARLRFLIPFVFLNFEKKLSNEALLRITQLAEHYEELASFGDPTALWLCSNLKKKWEYRIAKCEKHGDDAAEFFGKGVPTLRICVKEAEEVLKHVFEVKTSELPR
jgi:signal peptidase